MVLIRTRLVWAVGVILVTAACGRKAAPALETKGQSLEKPAAVAVPVTVPPEPVPVAAPAPASTSASASDSAAPTHKRLLPPKLTLSPLSELAFVPADVEAVVRVDLAQVGARSEHPAESLKTLDFLLHAQQPAAWQVLHDSGITVGKEIATMYLVVGPKDTADATLVVGLGKFDAERLGVSLRRSGATVEPAPAPHGETAALFTWKHPSGGSAGALEQPPSAAHPPAAAVGLGAGVVVFGPPALVRRAMSARAGSEIDVRTSPLAAELLAVDATATVWGVALPAADKSWLPTMVPGVRRARFQAALASPGPDIDGLFTLRAEFGSHDEATAFGDKLRQVLQTVALLGERSPLGSGFAKLKNGAIVKIDENVVIASAAL